MANEHVARPLATLVGAQGPTPEAPGHASFCVQDPCDAVALVHALVGGKAAASRLFQAQQVMCDGTPLARQQALAPGDKVTVVLRGADAARLSSAKAALSPANVLYQDTFMLAAEKPAGILVHGDGTDAETLTDRVACLLAQQGSAAVPQALHRLDVDTSGIVLFSLAEEFQPAFDALVAGDGLTKRYYALVEGSLEDAHGLRRMPCEDGWHVMSAPIARDRHNARRMRVGRTGKEAVTRLRTVGRDGARSLVEAELVTGRHHQIRVHLAYLGLPIVGDTLYGGARNPAGLMLHAHEVRFAHPLTGELVHVTSPFSRMEETARS